MSRSHSDCSLKGFPRQERVVKRGGSENSDRFEQLHGGGAHLDALHVVY